MASRFSGPEDSSQSVGVRQLSPLYSSVHETDRLSRGIIRTDSLLSQVMRDAARSEKVNGSLLEGF